MSRKKLDELTKERLVPIVYNSEKPKKTNTKKRYFVQTDYELFFGMSERLSRVAFRVAVLMLRDMNHYTNIFVGTYEEVEDELQLTKRPTREAMAELQQVDFIRKYRNGRYMINPNIAIGCSEEYLPQLLDTYYSLHMGVSKGIRSEKDVN